MRIRERLEAGESVAGALVLGDSIARGDEAVIPAANFMSLWAEELHARYGCRVVITNLSMGGATAATAYAMLRRVIQLSDYGFLIVAVGVNDAATHVPVRRFERTLAKIARYAAKHDVELLAVTPLRPTNADTGPYAEAIRRSGIPYADVHAVWNGMPLANGVNHPDETGHRLYAQVLLDATLC